MKHIILLLFISFAFSVLSTAHAGTFEQGIQAFEQKDYKLARKLWQPLAKEGDVRAQFNLALLMFKNKSQKVKANEYLVMSRAEGLIDAYLIEPPESGPEASKQTASNPPVSEPPVFKPLSNPAEWLRQQEESNYTLQLATGTSRKHLEKTQKNLLLKNNLDQPDSLTIHTMQAKMNSADDTKTSTRYILIYGVFDSYQRAKEGVDKLPESLQKSKPWIRKFGVLQSIVR